MNPLSSVRKTLLNITAALIVPIFFIGVLELAAQTFAARRIKNYFDDQTQHAFGGRVPAKAPGEYRIFIFGGSSAYGFPVADRHSIAAWLRISFQYLLPGKKITVVNAAWPGKASFVDYEAARCVLKYKPDLFIVYTGHNEANISNRLFIDHPINILNLRLKMESALYRFMLIYFHRARKYLVYGHAGQVEKQYREEILATRLYLHSEVTREEYAVILKHFQKNMESLVHLAKKHGIDVLFVQPASNIRDIPPAISLNTPGISEADASASMKLLEEGKKLSKENDYKGALAPLEQAVSLNPNYAEITYTLAQCYEKLGRYEEAKKYYLQARDDDAWAQRAKTELLAALVDIVKKHRLMYVEVEKAFESASPNGIAGGEFIYDDVHPSIQAQQIISDEILKVLWENGRVAEKKDWDWTAFEASKTDKKNEDWHIDGQINAYRYILRGLNLWEQKRYSDAAGDLEAGLKLMPSFYESYAFLADAYYRMGRTSDAKASFSALKDKDPSLTETLVHKYPDIEQTYSKLNLR